MLGTLLMDCQLGVAIKQGVIEKHVEMSHKKAKELLDDISEITNDKKENVLQCVKQHHGSDDFYSIESKKCCNADCYRFASIEGFLAGLKYMKDIPLEALVDLLDKKTDEKWATLTIESCKEELKLQYELIKQIVSICNKRN